MRTRMMALAVILGSAAVLATAGQSFSYIYKRGDSMHSRISGAVAFNRIGQIAKKYSGDFVWLRMNGRDYLIRDAATLAEVREAFRHLDEMEPSLREIERRLKPYERQMETIEERADELSDSMDDRSLTDAQRDAIEEKLRVADRQMRDLEEKMGPIERERERLEEESERREKIAEARFEKIVESAVARGIAERVD